MLTLNPRITRPPPYNISNIASPPNESVENWDMNSIDFRLTDPDLYIDQHILQLSKDELVVRHEAFLTSHKILMESSESISVENEILKNPKNNLH